VGVAAVAAAAHDYLGGGWMSRALVLGGGGVTGIAWELGVLTGLREKGLDLTGADVVVGTSAGSAVGAQVTCGADVADLYAREAGASAAEIPAGVYETPDLAPLFTALATAAQGVTSVRELCARVGRLALEADTVPEEERVAIFAGLLRSHEWPERRLLVTGVDAETGEPAVWSRESGVPLVSAVAASCAIPVVWPPVTVGGRRYIDGGIRSATNADLATGAESVIVLAPLNLPTFPGAGLAAELAALGQDVRTGVVRPDEGALAAIGPNVLDTRRRAAAAEAGRTQGAALADVLRDVWN
jgi:NTE family protein